MEEKNDRIVHFFGTWDTKCPGWGGKMESLTLKELIAMTSNPFKIHKK